MSKKIIISESQYRRVFLSEQGWSNYNNRGSGDKSEKSTNVSNRVANYYRLWANSTPELSKKYGKESEFDLDATRKDPTSGTFNKSYSQGKSQFDKDWLIVPNKYSYQDGDPKYGGRLVTDGGKSLFFTKGGEIKYKVNTKKVLPEKLSSKVLIYRYVNGREEIVDLDEDYWYDGRDIYKEVNNVYSSPNTKRATDVIEQEKKEDKEKLDAEIKSVKDSLKSDFGFTSEVIQGNLSQDHVVAQTVLNAMRKLNGLTQEKVHTGTKGKYDVCVKGFGTCTYGAGGKLYVANDFEDLANKINYRTDVGGQRGSYVVNITTVEFDFPKLQQELNDAFKRDKNARNSKSFPNGWFNFFTSYYGDNYSKVYKGISGIAPYEIKDNKETLNVYEKGKSVWGYLEDCATDYHCILDVASMVTLAIPGIGPVLSMTADLINAGGYGYEAATATSDEDQEAALVGMFFSLVGAGLGGGVKQSRELLGAANRNPKVYSYVDDVSKTVKAEESAIKKLDDAAATKRVAEIKKTIAEKHKLNATDIKNGDKIMGRLKHLEDNKELLIKYTNALKELEKRIDRAKLISVFKDEKFQKLLLENNDDIIKTLHNYSKTKAGKEFLQELAMFEVLNDVMTIPSVQEWVALKIKQVQPWIPGRDTIKNKVEAGGYDWKMTKELFGAILVEDPYYSNSQSKIDNSLLHKAWNAGWRPYPEGKKEPTEEDMSKSWQWLIDRPEFQTDKFKTTIAQMFSKKNKRSVTPKDEKDKKEGVFYHNDQRDVDMMNNDDNIVTDKEYEQDMGWEPEFN